jgi:hypothetical protein
MTEERKYAILFAATLLCARKLAEMGSNQPSLATDYPVNTAIEKAKLFWKGSTRNGQPGEAGRNLN